MNEFSGNKTDTEYCRSYSQFYIDVGEANNIFDLIDF